MWNIEYRISSIKLPGGGGAVFLVVVEEGLDREGDVVEGVLR